MQIVLGKDNGKSGAVEKVLPKKGKIWVNGANLVKRHVGKKTTGQEGGIIEIPKPMNISNVMLVCPNCKRPTRVGFKLEGGTKTRICRRCDKAIG